MLGLADGTLFVRWDPTDRITALEPTPEQLDDAGARVVRLGSTHNEIDAHLIATALGYERIPARVAGGHVGAAIPTGLLPIKTDVLVLARDFDRAREVIEGLSSRRAIDGRGRCVVCRYDMTGVDDALCPECGSDLVQVAGVHRTFRLAPPPGTDSRVQKLGALIGAALLILLLAGCVLGIVTEALRSP